MILQSLNKLYEDRLCDDESYGIPKPGYSAQKITFEIVLHPDGRLHGIQDGRETLTKTTKAGKTKTRQIARQRLVPGEQKPPGAGINPCTLWDNTAYLLGYKKDDDKPDRSAECCSASRDHHLRLEKKIDEPEYSAVCRFLESWSPDKATERKDQLDDFAATGFGLFRILGQNHFVHDTTAFRNWWSARTSSTTGSDVMAPCLVTGEVSPIARLADPAIKGVNGAAPGGAKLASFNLGAFESYAKEQTYNSPVSETATFQYCNTLNALLSGPRSNQHRIVIGDATTVFWTVRETVTESLFGKFLGGDAELPPAGSAISEENPVLRNRLESFLKILRKGGGADVESELGDDPNAKFHILGLSGNVTRLSVRFWHVGSIAQMVDRLKAHYDALKMVRSFDSEPEFPPLWALLRQTARESKDISPLLSGVLMQAILGGTPYPQAIYSAVLNRIRADHTINYLRAAILKAVLTRKPNFNQTIPMSLNTERSDPPYLLGRLFAVLEKTQEDALGRDINATIRDRFYSAASATPSTVFPRLLRTYQHHLSKATSEKGQGYKINQERLIQSIHAHLEAYPAHFDLDGQGLFAIGYYHQRQAFFTKKEKPGAPDIDSSATT